MRGTDQTEKPFHGTSYLFVYNSGTKRATEKPLTFLETREPNAADDIRLLSVAAVVYSQFAIEKRQKHREFTAGTQLASQEGFFFCTTQSTDSQFKIISIIFSTSSVTS